MRRWVECGEVRQKTEPAEGKKEGDAMHRAPAEWVLVKPFLSIYFGRFGQLLRTRDRGLSECAGVWIAEGTAERVGNRTHFKPLQ